ncbi:putative CCR4-associated factor 1 like 7 [Dendrobium catenatum]|uniref:Putative CCR4-associated factor 1 like 7 n=1 Tax=Dendrobium catenatum TaxID=906689 RepID=A0A2I0XAS2_9ASPA|nr:putative CCR4-associated factor 1 like 7 [Dendrobium catenatum]
MSALEKLYGDSAIDFVEIREIWNFNLEEEFFLISSIVADYPFVTMVKFPGVPLYPVGFSTFIH